MNNFRVNDWVLDDEDNLFQVTRVRDNEIALTNEPYYVLAEDFRLWTPKVGEWCWFYTRDTPMLSKFYAMEHDRYTESILWTNQDNSVYVEFYRKESDRWIEQVRDFIENYNPDLDYRMKEK